MISKSSRRDTIIVNCQLSIVNSAKPDKFQFIYLLGKTDMHIILFLPRKTVKVDIPGKTG